MKAPFSPYLDALVPGLRTLVELLGQSYDYVSVLSTDSVGFSVSISQRSKSVSGTNMTTERGSVVRVCRGGDIGGIECFEQYTSVKLEIVKGGLRDLRKHSHKKPP
jgi:hypothetical protein